MGYKRGISQEEELTRNKRLAETLARRKKPWGQTKFKGRYICAVCGDFIRENKGDKRERHEKRTIKLTLGKTDTFWTYRHKKCGPEKKETKK